MQHVNRISHVYCVDSTERVAPMLLDQLIHPGTQALPRLGRTRRLPQLRDEERDTHVFLDGNREPLKSFLEEPSQNKGRLFLLLNYTRPDINLQPEDCLPASKRRERILAV